MTLDEFRILVDAARPANPQWFVLPADVPPDEDTISEQSAQLGVQLPAEYLDFLREFGGGDFAFLAVYSMDPASDINIVAKNSVPWLRGPDFVAVSDNGAGDYYGFLVRDGECMSEVQLLDHDSSEVRPTGDGDWFEFVVARGLRQ